MRRLAAIQTPVKNHQLMLKLRPLKWARKNNNTRKWKYCYKFTRKCKDDNFIWKYTAGYKFIWKCTEGYKIKNKCSEGFKFTRKCADDYKFTRKYIRGNKCTKKCPDDNKFTRKYEVPSISFQTFCIGDRRFLKIPYVIAIHLMRWLTNFYDFTFKWTATAAIGIHPAKVWLSQLVNFKNAIWTWGHFRRTICNKILF